MRTHVANLPRLPWRLQFGPKRAQISRAALEVELRELPRHPSLFARDPRSLLQVLESMIRGMTLRHAEVLEAHDLKQFKAAMDDLVAQHTTRAVLFPGVEQLSQASLQGAHDMLEQLLGSLDISQATASAPAAPAPGPVVEHSKAMVEAARERRDQILANERFVGSADVHLAQGGARDAAGANNMASRLRRDGKLLGVWDGREFQHPAFQFDKATGRLNPAMERLLEILPKDRSGWQQAFWLFQPHALLDGASPAEVFAKNPQAVIDAAKSSFEPGDTDW